MKKKRVMACLVAGVCVLAVSATAAFGSVNGYANYKTAVKALALDVDNVTASGTYNLNYDGQTILSGTMDFAWDGADYSTHTSITDKTSGLTEENWNTTLDGVNTWFNSGDDHYYTYEAEKEKTGHGLLNLGEDDEFSQRVVTLLEMGADTVVGDLKNNVVEIAAADGLYTYQLDISSSQVPAVVNAALSVFAYAASESIANTRYVEFEDWNKCAVTFYEQETGETLPQDFKDHYTGEAEYDESWYEDNQELLDKLAEYEGEMHEHYFKQLSDELNRRGTGCGILFVKTDGTTVFYEDEATYLATRDDVSVSTNNIENFIGKDLTLDNVHFTFTVNKAGQLTANHCEASFSTVDKDGGKHTMVLTGDVALSDYGSTVVQPLDVGDRQPENFNTNPTEEYDEAVG